MTERPYRRKQRLPRPGLQWRLILAFGGLCLIGLLTHTLVVGAILVRHASELPGVTGLTAAVPGLMSEALLLSGGMVLPALILIGIRATFRVAGPLKRFELHLQAIVRGEDPGPCRLRKGDELHDLAALLDAGLDAAREQGRAEATQHREAA